MRRITKADARKERRASTRVSKRGNMSGTLLFEFVRVLNERRVREGVGEASGERAGAVRLSANGGPGERTKKKKVR